MTLNLYLISHYYWTKIEYVESIISKKVNEYQENFNSNMELDEDIDCTDLGGSSKDLHENCKD